MIKISNLTFTFRRNEVGERKILDDINLTIGDGESVAVMGANGSGKTTFARCLNGLLLPAAGDVEINGLNTKDAGHIPEIRRRVGMIFQNPENQIVSTTVEREIAFGLENLGVEREKMHRIVDEMLNRFDLTEYRTHAPHLLSGGEMQRLAVASILAMSPEILVLDEPTSLLDPAHRKDLLALLTGLSKSDFDSNSKTMITIFITQLPEEALFFKRLIVFNEGKICFDDKPSQIFEQVDKLKQIGIAAPLIFELNDYLKKNSDNEFSLNTSDFLPIL